MAVKTVTTHYCDVCNKKVHKDSDEFCDGVVEKHYIGGGADRTTVSVRHIRFMQDGKTHICESCAKGAITKLAGKYSGRRSVPTEGIAHLVQFARHQADEIGCLCESSTMCQCGHAETMGWIKVVEEYLESALTARKD